MQAQSSRLGAMSASTLHLLASGQPVPVTHGFESR